MKIITPPFFEIGPKNILRRRDLHNLCAIAEELAALHCVQTIVTVPATEIEAIKVRFAGLLVFAQHMDPDAPGPGMGRVIAEALIDAGADGTMINHAQHPLQPSKVATAIARARAGGLLSIVCAASDADLPRIVPHGPSVVLYEPPSLIGHPGGVARPWIRTINEKVRLINPAVSVMHAGGIGNPNDVFMVIADGAAGTGATSAIIRATDWRHAISSMLSAVQTGWSERQRRWSE